MEIKGSKMLKITGILEIIFGVICIIYGIKYIGDAKDLMSVANDYGLDELGNKLGGLVIFLSIVIIIEGIAQAIVGFLGVKNCKNPKGAKACFIGGLVILALCVVSLILSIANDAFTIAGILAFIVPGLYTYAAFTVKKNANA